MAEGQDIVKNPTTYNDAYAKFKEVIANASRTTQFMVELPPISTSAIGTESVLNETVAWTVKDISIPSKNLGQVILYHRGKQIKLPGDFNISDFTMTVYDTDKKEARRYFDTWFDTVFHSFEGVRGDVSEVKLNIKVTIFNTSGQVSQTGNKSMVFTMVGSFPMNIGEDARDWEGIDTVATFPITISVDDMAITYVQPIVG